MSLGRGTIQRSLLTILRKHERSTSSLRDLAEGMDTITLTMRVYRVKRNQIFSTVKTEQKAAVRRALASLAKEGDVIKLGTLYDRRSHWRINARKPLPKRSAARKKVGAINRRLVHATGNVVDAMATIKW